MSSSSTVVATSDTPQANLAEALKQAVEAGLKSLPTERMSRVAAATKTIQELRAKGLLRKQEYTATSSSEFERRYMAG